MMNRPRAAHIKPDKTETRVAQQQQNEEAAAKLPVATNKVIQRARSV